MTLNLERDFKLGIPAGVFEDAFEESPITASTRLLLPVSSMSLIVPCLTLTHG